MPDLEYLRTVQEIESYGIMPDRAPSLEPMIQALHLLMPDLVFQPKKTIVVAGTNGKGSVCATLETLLSAAGYTVGLFTSPHLEETTERIRINGKNVDKKIFCDLFKFVKNQLGHFPISHFEILTLMAASAFFSEKFFSPLDWIIFEVGLGGKWDATNAIPHQNCVITSLGYDHQNLLGNSLFEIAENKFGIIGPNATVVHSPFPEGVDPLKEKVQRATQTVWRESTPFSYRVEQTQRGPQFFIKTKWGEAALALPGIRGAQNTATAFTLLNELGINPTQLVAHIKNVDWPGRMEKWKAQDQSLCPIFFSGDHNPQGIHSLLEILTHYPRQHLYSLVGIGKEKNRDEILAPLFDLKHHSIFLTETPFRGLTIDDYGKWTKLAAGIYKNPLDALNKICALANKNDMILVTGSLYLVGFLKKELADRP